MSLSKRKYSSGSLRTLPCGSILRADVKISLFTDDASGWLCAAGLYSRDLQVESGDFLDNFERAVFTVRDASESSVSDNEIAFGQCIKLWHEYSQTWVCVNKRVQSESEKSCCRVCLVPAEEIDDDIIVKFRILPKYKIRSEGEKVKIMDQITLMPFGWEDCRYLHVAKASLDHNRPTIFEANCAYTPTGWAVLNYDDCPATKGTVRLGQPVVLFNAEIEAFLTCDGMDFDFSEQGSALSRVTEAVVVMDSLEDSYKAAASPTQCTVATDATTHTGQAGNHTSDGRQDSCVVFEEADGERSFVRRIPVGSRHYYSTRFANNTHASLGAKSSPGIFESSADTFDKSLTLPDSVAGELATQLASELGHSPYATNLNGSGDFFFGSPTHSQQQNGATVQDDSQLIAKVMERIPANEKPGQKPAEQRTVYLLQMEGSGHRHILEPMRMATTSLWIVENPNPARGGPVLFNVLYNLKHVATNKYLVVLQEEGRYKFALSSSKKPRKEESLFVFQPIDEGQSHVKNAESCFRILHAGSDLCLHFLLNNTSNFAQKRGDRTIISVGLSTVAYYEDVYTCRPVPSTDLLSQLNFVLFNYSHLVAYINAFWHHQVEYRSFAMGKVISNARMSLSRLILFCSDGPEGSNPLTHNGRPLKHRQQLLLDQNVHRVVMEVLQCPFQAPPGRPGERPLVDAKQIHAPEHRAVQLMCILGYKLLKAMVEGRPPFAMELSRFIPFMQTQLPHGFRVADTLMAIFKDNRVLLEGMDEEVLTCFVSLSHLKGKQAQYIKFLCALCECEGVGIRRNQRTIATSILQKSPELLLRMKVDTGRVLVKVPLSHEYHVLQEHSELDLVGSYADEKAVTRPKTPTHGRFKAMVTKLCNARSLLGNAANLARLSSIQDLGLVRDKWYPIDEFCSRVLPTVSDYLEVSLSLFSKLCVSHNRHTKPLVRKIVGKDMVVNVLGHRSRHKALPDRFKREFYQIATNVYLDKPMLYQWNLRNSIKLWSRLKPRTAGPDEQLNNNANDLFLKEIKLASVQLLKENTVLVSTQRERNSLLKAVLQMWEVLIRNRQYSAAEVDLLLPILLDLLDGRTDQEGQLPSPGGTLASPYRRPSTPAAVGVSVSTARSSKRYDLDSAKQAPPTWDNYERYQPTDANVIIMDCKAEVLKILETLMDQYVDDCVEELLTMFKNCFKDLMPTPSPSFSGRQASWMSEMSHANELELIDFPVEQLVQNLMPQLAAYLSEKSFDGSEGMGADGALNRTLRAMGNILSNTRLQARRHEPHGLSSLKEVFTVHRLCPILLDLLLYKDPTVMSKSLSLLYRVFSLKAEVGKVVQEQQLLFDMESETTFHNVCDSARRLYSCLDSSPITPKVEEGIGLLSSYFSYLLEPWDTNGHGLTHHPATYFSRMFRGFSSPSHSPTRRETSQSYQSYLPLASGQCSPRPGLRALPYMSFIPPDPLPRNLAFSAFVAAVAERQKQSLEAQVSPMHFDLHVQESSPPSRGGVVSPDGRRDARSRSRSPNSCGNSHTASTCSSAPQGVDSKATTAGTAGGRPSAAATLSPSSSSRRQLSTDPEKLFLEPTLGLSRANTVEVVSTGSPGDSPVRVHSSDKSPFLSLPGPSSRNATPQKDRDDGPRLVSPELLDDIIEGHGIWATDASDGPHRPRRSSNESGTKQKKTEPKPAASSSVLRRAASSAAHAALHTLDLKAMLDRQHSMQSDFPSPGRPHISVSVASLKRADTTLVPRHTPSSARLMKVRHLSVDLLGLQQEGGTSPRSGGSCLSDMDRFNRNVSFGAENATDSSDDDEGPLSGEGSDDEEAALIGRFNYVAVNQEIMRNVGVHTLILRTLRLPFTGRKQERRRQAFIECYRFLIFFCNNNARNQEAVFSPENCSIFLKHIPLDVGADKAIHQLFQNNYRLCSQVREDVVNSVVMLLSHDDDGAHLRFIKGLVVVNGSIPVPRNQTMVMNNLVTQYGDLIQTNQAVDGDLDRHVLRRIVAIVDIMAACCVGLNRATEGPARTMIPIRPLLKTLCEEHAPLPLVMQVPYMTFLREVYWVQDTDEPIALQQIQFWLTDGDWWAAVGLMQDIVLRFMVNELGDVPVEDYITYIFDGVLPCLSDYLRMFWDQFTEADAEHLRAIKTIVAELCKLPSVPVPEMTLVHWDMLKSFLEICQEVTVVQEPLQEHIAACEGQLCTPNQAPSVRLFTLIQRGLTSLQEACLKQFKLDSVDDMPTFTELICDHLKDQNEDLILRTLVEQMKRGSNLTQRVKVITLRFFTQLLIRSRLTSTTRLSSMQVKMSDPQQLAIVPLMSLLAEGEDEAVAYEAVDFGTHLLEGGNAVAQGALLQWFQNPDVRLITSMCYKLRKSIQVLRERKAEKLILEENGTNEDRANFRQMLASKREINEMPVVLRLLQLFCEGHHIQMQNYVRQQIGNPHSVNTVSEVLLFLREVLLTGIDETTVMMARQAFDTLTEFCQGPCALNQATLMDLTPNVCNEANQVLSPEFDRCCIPEALAFELRGKAVLTLLSLLEGGHHRRTVGQMTHSLSFEAMRHTLDRMWKIVEPTMSDTLITGDMEALDMAFNMYILLCSLHRERDGEACGACEVLRDFQGEACFRTLLGVVEIARDGMVERVLFRKPDCFRMLSQEARDRVLITVDRESPHRKLADFFEQANHIIFEMEYHAYLQSALQGFMPPVPVYDNPLYQKYLYDWLLKVRMSLVALPRTSVGLWHYCTGVVAIVTNVVVCTLTYYEDEDFQLSIHHGSHMILQAVLNLCSSLMLLLNLTTCMSLVVFTMPVLIHKAEAEKRAHAEAQPTLAQNISAVFSLHYYDFCLVVFTLLGIFVSPMFFSIHLLSVIQQSVLLRSVVRAVTLNGRSLLLTGLLCVIVVYLFTIVAFVTFREDFVDATGTHYCDNLIECFIFSINNGIRAGGGLGELLASRRWGQELYASRILFDSAYFVVVIVCLLNIVFGIIIDTFAELRDQRQKIEADTKARCFICGISSSTFDRFVEGGFREHVLNQHNMWQYLYFMLHLRHKPEAEYTGQESYVQAKIRQKDISFFPLNRSLELDVLERDTGSQPDVTPVEVTAVDVPASSAGLLEIERRLQAKIEESSKEMQHRLEGVETAVQHMEKSLQIMMAKVTALCEAQNATGKGGENLYNLSSRFSTHAAIPRRASQLLTTMNIDIPYVGQPGRTGVAAAAARCPSPSALSLSGGPSSPPHNTVVSPVNRLSPGPDARG